MEDDSDLEEDEYYVEKVLDKKVIKGQDRYLIKWEGWPEDASTWEPLENLGNINNLIEDFEKRRQNKNNGKYNNNANNKNKSEKAEENNSKYTRNILEIY